MTMAIPTPTIATKTIDGQQLTRATWTVGDHTLTRTERADAGPAHWHTGRLNNDAPRVDEDTDYWHDDTAPITYSVNWSACGDRTPGEAVEYATRLMMAATAAHAFAAIRSEHQ